jgi:hypothetical protein
LDLITNNADDSAGVMLGRRFKTVATGENEGLSSIHSLFSVPEEGGENETQIHPMHFCFNDYFDSMGLWPRYVSNVPWPSIAQESSGFVTVGFCR